MLFHNKKIDKREICINYLEGLEWVFKYYTVGCPDWRWKYHHSYPPLFKDILQSIPNKPNTEFIQPHINNKPFSPYLQLAYVLPDSQLSLLPSEMTNYLRTHFTEFYPSQYEFIWAFCRYFWEAHPILPDIPMNQLNELDTILREMKK